MSRFLKDFQHTTLTVFQVRSDENGSHPYKSNKENLGWNIFIEMSRWIIHLYMVYIIHDDSKFQHIYFYPALHDSRTNHPLVDEYLIHYPCKKSVCGSTWYKHVHIWFCNGHVTNLL